MRYKDPHFTDKETEAYGGPRAEPGRRHSPHPTVSNGGGFVSDPRCGPGQAGRAPTDGAAGLAACEAQTECLRGGWAPEWE